MSNKLKRNRKKKKQSTWADVLYYAIIGTVIDFIFTFEGPGSQTVCLTDIGNGNLDEWGKKKASLVRSVILFLVNILIAALINYPNIFNNGTKNQQTAAIWLLGLQGVIGVICIVNIIIKEKYKRKR